MEPMRSGVHISVKMKLLIAVLILQLCFAGFHIVSRVALNIGVSKVVYPVYRNLLALILLAPFAYFYEKITANQGFYILGLYYATPSFASAMQNSVPAITFLMASALRLESVNIARRDGLAKIIGTLASVGGAMVITLYKGPPLLRHDGAIVNHEDILSGSTKMLDWTWGCIYLLGHCLSWAGWMVFQAPIVKKYPAKLSLTSFTFFFGLLQFMVIAAFCEKDPVKWKIKSGEELFTILYAGIISSGIVLSLQTWCIQKGGPVFVAVFQPVQTVLVAIMAFVILHDQFYLGGLLGAVLIMIGLYSVLWGKTEEQRIVAKQLEINEDPLTKHLLDNNNKNQDSAMVSDIP
ncbi:Drug/metabolite transporter (chloroplast) [Artemisia annua]|uniref:WAT1-related protein n=1 Tax=Artemisia annua TaxID=35608 RepID=A0A2U1NE81_ARTAN|nr:Drug/metabolite transporter [Artemisia annua]